MQKVSEEGRQTGKRTIIGNSGKKECQATGGVARPITPGKEQNLAEGSGVPGVRETYCLQRVKVLTITFKEDCELNSVHERKLLETLPWNCLSAKMLPEPCRPEQHRH